LGCNDIGVAECAALQRVLVYPERGFDRLL
jgi:hypothetical protein